MFNRRKRIGIDINEIFRAKWLQFDRFYVTEFDEKGVPDQPYVYDFFENYKFDEVIEDNLELKEPEDMPDINTLDYAVNDKNVSKADAYLFKDSKKIKKTPKEVYNEFMYVDYCYEIHGSAPLMYKNMDNDVQQFYTKFHKYADFIAMSVENYFSTPSTLFFLSKMLSRFKRYIFVDNSLDMWKHVDVLITSDPKILEKGAPWGKKLIKVRRPYNDGIGDGNMEILQLIELTKNDKFKKLIKYKKTEQDEQ